MDDYLVLHFIILGPWTVGCNNISIVVYVARIKNLIVLEAEFAFWNICVRQDTLFGIKSL